MTGSARLRTIRQRVKEKLPACEVVATRLRRELVRACGPGGGPSAPERLSAGGGGRSPAADEAIHLASAFQLAGYRHVIATMWPTSDHHAVDITDRIYAALTTTGETDAAGAVHATARLMRRRWNPGTPPAWASHIHAGA